MVLLVTDIHFGDIRRVLRSRARNSVCCSNKNYCIIRVIRAAVGYLHLTRAVGAAELVITGID
eukprot:3903504-Pyramimonas_sp.AAC.1